MLVGRTILQNAQTTGTGAVLDLRPASQSVDLKFTIIGNGVITGGTIQPEEADDPAFAGTWAPVGAPIAVAAGVQTVRSQGSFRAVRGRITANVTGGGTVTVIAEATSDE